MNKELKNIIELDLKRIYELPLSRKQRSRMALETKYVLLWRKAVYYRGKNLLKSKICNYRLMKMSNKTQIQIPLETTIGKGLYIGHLGRIIISPFATLGDNINLSTGITIGAANRGERKGAPTIGNNVWIGTNAVIVGKINIGNDVMIAPGAFVNMDVPDHSIVIGNPGVIHHRDNATEGYINKTV